MVLSTGAQSNRVRAETVRHYFALFLQQLRRFIYMLLNTEGMGARRWIVLWNNASLAETLSAEACKEAELEESESSFQGTCSIIFSSVLAGLAISVSSSVQLATQQANSIYGAVIALP